MHYMYADYASVMYLIKCKVIQTIPSPVFADGALNLASVECSVEFIITSGCVKSEERTGRLKYTRISKGING